MAYKPVYLEPDEEITSVIDKIANSPDKSVALVLAKNSALFQSLVNLKLLAKEAKKQGKDVALITANKVGARLAGQVGIKTYGALGALPATPETPAVSTVPTVPDEVIDGVKVQQYDPNRQHSEQPAEDGLEQELESNDQLANQAEKVVPEPATAEPKPQFEPKTVKPEELPTKPEPVSSKPDDLPAVISRSSGFSVHREFKIPWKSVGIGAGVLLGLLLLAYVFLPRATVTITFFAEALSEKVAVSAIADLKDQQAGAITGSKVTTEKSKTETITATGKKDVGTKAKGSVTITNKYTDGNGVGRDQSFAAGTKLTDTKTDKVFVLDSAVSVGRVTYNPNNGQPVYKSATVSVTATAPGEEYNIGASSFSLAGALSNTPVTSSSAFAGGLTKVVTVLSQDDVDTAVLKLKKAAKEEALKELEEKAAGGKILSDAIWEDVKTEEVDRSVGDEVESAQAELVVEYGTVVFDEAQALALFTAKFNNRITADEEVVFSEQYQPTFVTKKTNASKGQINFEISGTAYKVPKIDKTRIAKAINNQAKTTAAEQLMNEYAADEVSISLSPSWWVDRLPLLSQAISVEYGFTQESKEEPNQ